MFLRKIVLPLLLCKNRLKDRSGLIPNPELRFKDVFGLNAALLSRVEKIVLGDHFDNYFRLNKEKAVEKRVPVIETREFMRDFVLRIPGYAEKLISLSHNNITTLNLNKLVETHTVAVGHPVIYRGFIEREAFLPSFYAPHQRGILEVLGANAGAGTSKERDMNVNSFVVRIGISSKNILVMGDATGDTTDRILQAIEDPSILRSELLIASHHGAENENANHISFASVTAPKNIAISNGFNEGYKHPTLAAIINFLAKGQIIDKPRDPHIILAYNVFGPYVLTLSPQIQGLEMLGLKAGQASWLNFKTSKSIYCTGSSGDIEYVFSDTGNIVSVTRQY